MSKPRDDEGLTERQRYWHDHLKCARASGQSLVAYAQEQGLRVKSLYHYARIARGEVGAQASKEARFVRISAPVVASVAGCIWPMASWWSGKGHRMRGRCAVGCERRVDRHDSPIE